MFSDLFVSELLVGSPGDVALAGRPGKPGQPSVSSFTGTKKGCSTHLSALSSLHMLQKLVAESAVTMTTVQESPLLVEQYCDTEEVIWLLMEFQVKITAEKEWETQPRMLSYLVLL